MTRAILLEGDPENPESRVYKELDAAGLLVDKPSQPSERSQT